MKPVDAGQCRVHILVCTNERTDGMDSCLPLGGQEFFLKLKRKVATSGLISTHWVTRTGCLGFCNPVGTTVTIHPKGQAPRWYSEVKDSDFDFIWSEIVRQ